MIKYIVELTKFNTPIYSGYDITEAIDKATKAGFTTSLYHIHEGIIVQTDMFSPKNGWEYSVNK